MGPVTLDSALEEDLGLDSLARVELSIRLERAFGVRPPEHMLNTADALRDLLRALLAARGPPPPRGQQAQRLAVPERASSVPHAAATLQEVLDWHLQAHPQAQADVPVVPVTIRGTRSVLHDGQWFPRRVPISVVVSAPFQPDGDDWSASIRLRDAVRAQTLNRCAEPDADAESRLYGS